MLATAALLALGGTAAALAHDGDDDRDGDRAAYVEKRAAKAEKRATKREERRAAACERLAKKVTKKTAKLQRKQAKIEARLARIDAQLTGGQLTPEQQGRATVAVAKLERKLTKLADKLARLQAVEAERCSNVIAADSTTSVTGHDVSRAANRFPPRELCSGT